MTRNAVLVAIYRSMLKEARKLRQSGDSLPCRRPASRDEWGKGRFEKATAGKEGRSWVKKVAKQSEFLPLFDRPCSRAP